VENYVIGCLVCQRNKAQTVKKAGLLQPRFVPSFKNKAGKCEYGFHYSTSGDQKWS
jgi:hypothetical protein